MSNLKPGKNFSSLLGTPITSVEEAIKVKRNAILWLAGVSIFQALFGIFFWWISTRDSFASDIHYALIFSAFVTLVFGVVEYLWNSRIAAGIIGVLVLIGVLEWLVGAISSGDYGGNGMRILWLIIAYTIISAVFRIHAWQKRTNTKLPRSKFLSTILAGTFFVILAALLIPPLHYSSYLKNDIKLTEEGEFTSYYDARDQYTFRFPKTWTFKHIDYSYGSVVLFPEQEGASSIQIERWAPWDVAPVSFYNTTKFMEWAESESKRYAEENEATVESVQLVELGNIKVPRIIYTEADGSKQYVYYIYNRNWNRDTSDADFYFWRILVRIPKGFSEYEKAMEAVATSFRLD